MHRLPSRAATSTTRAVDAAIAAVLKKQRERAAAGRWLRVGGAAAVVLAATWAWANGLATLVAVAAGAVVAVPLLLVAVVTALSFVVGKPFTARASAFFVPRAMRRIDALLGDVRKELLKDVRGAVLDVGCADGSSYLKYYAAAGADVTKIVFLEPNEFHHAALRRNVAQTSALSHVEVAVVGCFIEDLDVTAAALEARGRRRQRTPPATHGKKRSLSRSRSPSRGRAASSSSSSTAAAAAAAGFDWIVVGNVLCEVPNPHAVVAHVDRLLKPGGNVYFSEHHAHPDGTWARALQEAVNPWWCVVSDGCNCNRPTTWMQQFGPGKGTRTNGRRWDVRQWTVDMNILAPFVIGVARKPTLG